MPLPTHPVSTQLVAPGLVRALVTLSHALQHHLCFTMIWKPSSRTFQFRSFWVLLPPLTRTSEEPAALLKGGTSVEVFIFGGPPNRERRVCHGRHCRRSPHCRLCEALLFSGDPTLAHCRGSNMAQSTLGWAARRRRCPTQATWASPFGCQVQTIETGRSQEPCSHETADKEKGATPFG